MSSLCTICRSLGFAIFVFLRLTLPVTLHIIIINIINSTTTIIVIVSYHALWLLLLDVYCWRRRRRSKRRRRWIRCSSWYSCSIAILCTKGDCAHANLKVISSFIAVPYHRQPRYLSVVGRSLTIVLNSYTLLTMCSFHLFVCANIHPLYSRWTKTTKTSALIRNTRVGTPYQCYTYKMFDCHIISTVTQFGREEATRINWSHPCLEMSYQCNVQCLDGWIGGYDRLETSRD